MGCPIYASDAVEVYRRSGTGYWVVLRRGRVVARVYTGSQDAIDFAKTLARDTADADETGDGTIPCAAGERGATSSYRTRITLRWALNEMCRWHARAKRAERVLAAVLALAAELGAGLSASDTQSTPEET